MLTKLTVVSGFGQHEGLWNGNYELKEVWKQEFDQEHRRSVDIQLYPYNTNWKWVARQYHLERLRYKLTREEFQVIVAAYSWGVGNGLVRFAWALKKYGIDILHAVICDGIYRHAYPGGEWRSYFGDLVPSWSTIVFPPNVKKVTGFYQEETRPMGQKPVTDAPMTWERLYYPHVEMDDAPEWHLACVDVAKSYIQSAKQVKKTPDVPPATTETLKSEVLESKLNNV